MKVILIDNLNRKSNVVKLLAEDISKKEAKKIAKQYNDSHMDNFTWEAKVVNDNYNLTKI